MQFILFKTNSEFSPFGKKFDQHKGVSSYQGIQGTCPLNSLLYFMQIEESDISHLQEKEAFLPFTVQKSIPEGALMTVPKHPIQATPLIPKVLQATDIVQIIPTNKITSTTTLTSIESTTKVPQTTTPLEVKTMETIDSTPAITTAPTLSTTSSIPTALVTTIDMSTTEATVEKERKRKILMKMPMKKVNIFN